MEIRRNYEAVNEAVEVERRKALEAMRIRRATKYELYTNSGLKLAAAAALLLVAYGIVMWLLREDSDTLLALVARPRWRRARATSRRAADRTPVGSGSATSARAHGQCMVAKNTRPYAQSANEPS